MKKSLVVLVACLALFAIMSCTLVNDKATTVAMDQESKAAAPVTLKMLAYVDVKDVNSKANFVKLLDAFKTANPDITLTVEYAYGDEYHAKLAEYAKAGTLPELMFLWPGKRTANVTDKGLVADLKGYLAGKEDQFTSAALASSFDNGAIYELPEQLTATHVLYSNDALLAKLGLKKATTIDELIAQQAAIAAAGKTAIAIDNKDGWQMQSIVLGALVNRTGGKAWFDKARKGEAKFTDPEFVNALKIISDLSKAKMFPATVNEAAYGDALKAFTDGNAVYLLDGSWRAQDVMGDKGFSVEEQANISLTVLPDPDAALVKGASMSTSTVPGTGYGMKAGLAKELAAAAWEWIWFYSGPKGSAIRHESGTLPAYKLDSYTNKKPLFTKLVNFLNTTPSGYVVDAVMDGEGMAVLQAGLKAIVAGTKTCAEVAAEYEA